MQSVEINMVLDFLTKHWSTRASRIYQFLEETFGYTVDKPYLYDKMFIMQMKDGDARNKIMGTFYLSKWLVKDGQHSNVPINFEDRELYKLNESQELYIYPRYLFNIDGNEIFLSERYGPDLFIRSFGKLKIERENVSCILEVEKKSMKFEILKKMGRKE